MIGGTGLNTLGGLTVGGAAFITGNLTAPNVYTKDETNALLNGKATTSTVYTQAETDLKLSAKAFKSETYSDAEVDGLLA